MEDIKKINSRKIKVNYHIINFTYETRNGKYREQQRSIQSLENEDPKDLFLNWRDKNERTMSNVKILGIDEIKEKSYYIEL